MNIHKVIPITTVLSLCLFGCDRPEKTIDSLREGVASFRAAPDDQKYVTIEKDLAKLDGQILKLRNQGKYDKATLLQRQRDSLAADFGAAKIHRTLQDAKSALKGIQDVIQKTGEVLLEGFSEPVIPSPAPKIAAPEPMAAPSPLRNH